MLNGERAKIVANLPYNIATALLTGWLSAEPWPPWYDAMVLMFQREVAERIVAAVDDDAYGRLAVFAGWRTEAKIMFDVAPSCVRSRTEGDLVGRSPHSARSSRAVRPADAGARHRSRLRPAAKDAAAKPEVARRRSGAPDGRGRRRSHPACGDRPDRGLCCHGARIIQYTRHHVRGWRLREKRHGVDASPVARQVRCSALRNCRRDAEAARRRGARAHRALRTVPFGPAHPGRLRRPRRRQPPRHHARHDAALHARPRDRRRRR